MIAIDFPALVAATAVTEPLLIRTIAFDLPTFALLKEFRRRLIGKLRHRIGNAAVVKYLLHSHPAVAEMSEARQ